MKLNKASKQYLLTALDTEIARYKRMINAQDNQAIKEILDADLRAMVALSGELHNEVVNG